MLRKACTITAFPVSLCRAIGNVRFLETATRRDFRETLVIKNLPKDLSWQALKDLMKEFGFVRSCSMIKVDDIPTAMVSFGQESDLMKVIEQIRTSPQLNKLNLDIVPYRLPEVADSDVKDIGTSRLFVKGLPKKCRWQDLKDHMRLGGEVFSVLMNTDAELNFVHSAVVIFKTVADASRAYAVLRNSPFHGKVLDLRPDMVPIVEIPSVSTPVNPFMSSSDTPDILTEARTPSRAVAGKMSNKLIVFNLHFEVGWKELKDHFRLAGSIVKADVLVDKNGVSKGVGVVYFETEEGAAKAVEKMHMSRIRNRPIKVRFDIPVEEAREERAVHANQVYIDGIPYDADKNEVIKLICASTEGFESLTLAKDDRLEKQTATVVFNTVDNAQMAIRILNESLMMENVLRVKPFRNWTLS